MLMFDNELQAVRDASGFTDEELILLENEFEEAFNHAQYSLDTIDRLWELQDDLRETVSRTRDSLIRAGERTFVAVSAGLGTAQQELERGLRDEYKRYLGYLDVLEPIIDECVKNGVLHAIAPWELSNGNRLYPSATKMATYRQAFLMTVAMRESEID